MTLVRKWGPWAVLLAVAVAVLAVGLNRGGGRPSLDSQVQHISSEVRCPVCHGETVAQSQAAPSVEIRNLIRADLQKGQTESQILSSLVASYGTSILEKPQAKGIDLLVWVVPVVAVVLGAVGLLLGFRRWRSADDEADDEVSEEGGLAGAGPTDVAGVGAVDVAVVGPTGVAGVGAVDVAGVGAVDVAGVGAVDVAVVGPTGVAGVGAADGGAGPAQEEASLEAVGVAVRARAGGGSGAGSAAGGGSASDVRSVAGAGAASPGVVGAPLLAEGLEPPGPSNEVPAGGRKRRTTKRVRVAAGVAGVVLVAGGASWAVAASSGTRLPGQGITGQALGAEAESAAIQAATKDESNNDMVGAVKEYQKVLASNPRQVQALSGEGWLLAETGQPALLQQGLSLLQSAEKVQPDYGPAHLYRGLALLGEGDYADSVPELQWYLDHSPDPKLAPQVRTALAQAKAKAATQTPAPTTGSK